MMKKERREKIRIIDMVFNCCAKTDKTLKQGIDKEKGGTYLGACSRSRMKIGSMNAPSHDRMI